MIATVVPILIMAVAGFMILDQLQIAETIVTITYASLLGAVAFGMALAFGLGGREVAARMLEGAYQVGQQNREQIKQDLQQGRDAARDEAERVRSNLQEDDTIQGDTDRCARHRRAGCIRAGSGARDGSPSHVRRRHALVGQSRASWTSSRPVRVGSPAH